MSKYQDPRQLGWLRCSRKVEESAVQLTMTLESDELDLVTLGLAIQAAAQDVFAAACDDLAFKLSERRSER